jgi:SAM-dependent methyltransferase
MHHVNRDAVSIPHVLEVPAGHGNAGIHAGATVRTRGRYDRNAPAEDGCATTHLGKHSSKDHLLSTSRRHAATTGVVCQQYVPALGFNVLTPLFDQVLGVFGFGRRQREQVVALLDLTPADRLLDVGCGTGTQLIAAKQRCPGVAAAGVDVDGTILRIARDKVDRAGIHVGLVQASADALPFAAGAETAVVSTLIFHHLPTDVKRGALAEVHRVLAPQGRFLLVDFGETKGRWMRLFARVVRILRLPEAATMQDSLLGQLPDFMGEAGFDVRPVARRHRGIDYLLATKHADLPWPADTAQVDDTAPSDRPPVGTGTPQARLSLEAKRRWR